MTLPDFLKWLLFKGIKLKGTEGHRVQFTVAKGQLPLSEHGLHVLHYFQPAMLKILQAGEEFTEEMDKIIRDRDALEDKNGNTGTKKAT